MLDLAEEKSDRICSQVKMSTTQNLCAISHI